MNLDKSTGSVYTQVKQVDEGNAGVRFSDEFNIIGRQFPCNLGENAIEKSWTILSGPLEFTFGVYGRVGNDAVATLGDFNG